MQLRPVFSVVLVSFTLSSAVFAAESSRFRSGEVLVQFKEDADPSEVFDAVLQGDLASMRHLPGPAAGGRAGLDVARTGLPVQAVVDLLNRHPAVEFAEPNWIYRHQAVSNDPYFVDGNLWGMYGDQTSPANNFGSQAGEAWAAGHLGSRSVCVGIIDEGVNTAHPDLAANVWVNPGETAGDGIDNDGNGYVDDVHGWDFFSDDASVYDAPNDQHGTHVAGTIGGEGGNGAGVAGVNWEVTLISAKFLGPNGGSTADAVAAVDYLVDLKTRHGLDLVAINNSWGGGGYSQALHDAIIRAAKAGIFFVAAAGNGDIFGRAINIDNSAYYPASYDTLVGTSTETAASYDGVIAVTAISSSGGKASWANYGATRVDLGAPGVSVWSTVPGGYDVYSGTSMATPHVTGALALLAAVNPAASPQALRSALLDRTLATTSLSGRTVTGGRLNLSDVTGVTEPPPPPPAPATAPANLGATAVSKSQINLAWTDTTSDNQGFKIYRSVNGGSFALRATVASPNAQSYSDSGLSRNTDYAYYVTAYNLGGESPASNTASAKTPKR